MSSDSNLSRGTGTNQSVYDLQSIQVVRGPQGTLFGRNSTGGAVLIEPNRPSDFFEGYAQASVGNYNFHDLEAMINIPLSDHVKFRAAGKMSRRDGYLRSVITGQDANDLKADSIRVSLSIEPGDDIESRFIGTYYKGGGAGQGLKLYFVEPRGVPQLGVARPFVVTALQNELAATQSLGNYEYRNPRRLSSSDEAYSIQNNTSINLGSITIKNIIGYRHINNIYDANFSGGSVDVFDYSSDNSFIRGKSFSEEFQVQGELTNLEYIVGAYYFHESGTDAFTSNAFAYLSRPDVLAAGGPALAAFVTPRFPGRNRTDVDSRNISYAAFVHGDYDLSAVLPGLSVTGGARITKDKRRAVYHSQNQSGLAPVNFPCAASGAALPSIDRTKCAAERNTSSSQLTYDVGVNYEASDDTLIYGAIRRGYRTGGLNIVPPLLPASEDGVAFEPETVTEAELGVKTDFQLGTVRGRLNVAGFYQWFNDIQRTQGSISSTGTFASFVSNAAKMHIPGGEAELTLYPTDSLRISASYALIRPKYDEFNDLRVVGGVPTLIDVSDSRLILVPYDQYNLAAEYTLPLEESLGEVKFNIAYAWQGGFATAEPETNNCGPGGIYLNCLSRQGALPSYGLLNARIDWRNVAGAGFDLAIFVNNATDKFYRPYAANLISNLGLASASVGTPRMFGFEMRLPFGQQRY